MSDFFQFCVIEGSRASEGAQNQDDLKIVMNKLEEIDKRLSKLEENW